MRPMSKAAKVEAFDRVKRERDALDDFAWHTVNGHAPDHVEVAKMADGARYTFKLYGTMRADGGIVVIAFKSDRNDSAQVTAHYCMDYEKIDRDMGYGIPERLPIRIAWEHCRAAQSRIWQAEREKLGIGG